MRPSAFAAPLLLAAMAGGWVVPAAGQGSTADDVTKLMESLKSDPNFIKNKVDSGLTAHADPHKAEREAAWVQIRSGKAGPGTDRLYKLVERGDVESMYLLGRFWDQIVNDQPEATRWFSRAADAGHVESSFWAGVRATNGMGMSVDGEVAYRRFLFAAENGHAAGQLYTGRALARGYGVARDPAAARQWLYKALQNGEAGATEYLAELDAAEEAAAGAVEQAATTQADPASSTLADGIAAYDGGDYQRALEILRPIAVRGDAVAQSYLGTMHEQGNGVEQDAAKAFHWFEMAAQQAEPFADYRLGMHYASGEVVEQDLGKAIVHFTRAAENGKFRDAQFNLGLIHEDGRGTPRDLEAAKKWYMLAADQGNTNAMVNLAGILEAEGPDGQLAAHRLYEKAAAAGSGLAAFNLGALYFNGGGVIVRNRDTAKRWFMRAVELGYKRAEAVLASNF